MGNRRLPAYLVSILSVAVALGLQLLLAPFIGSGTPFILFFGAVIVSAWLGGLGPGLLATGLSALAATYYFIPRTSSIVIDGPANAVRVALFLVECCCISALCEVGKRSERGREQVMERERRTLRFLDRASILLVEDSADYQKTLRRLAQLLVPEFADWCSIHTRFPQGQITAVAIEHADPARMPLVRQLHEAYCLNPDGSGPAAAVLRTGKSHFAGRLQESDLIALAQDGAHLRILHELQLHSLIVVPLSVRGDILGAIALGNGESARCYREADLALAEDLAFRTALAMDNARLLEAERLARAEAENANRVKDDFLATLSHELRTPLNSIIGYSQLLRRGRMNAAMVEQALETIERNGRLQGRLIEDLLDVSRIIRGKLKIARQPVPLASVLVSAVEMLRPTAQAKGLTIEAELPATADTTVTGDATRLEQVVWNLLSNAIKFTPAQGKIKVSLQAEAQEARLIVSDTGIGIEPDFLPLLFERFRQAESGPTRPQGGLGLGLAIVRHIVEAHGGRVQAESAGADQGSSFIVTLPAIVPAAGERP